jgi:hypothetical protein
MGRPKDILGGWNEHSGQDLNKMKATRKVKSMHTKEKYEE